jgi:hypothetical protein
MVRNRSERGEGRLGCLFGIILVLAAALVAYKMIPVKVKAADLRDAIEDEAKSAGQNTDKQILSAILNRAQILELPVSEDKVQINRSAGSIQIDVQYTVPIEFPGYTHQWKFHHKTNNPIF